MKKRSSYQPVPVTITSRERTYIVVVLLTVPFAMLGLGYLLGSAQ